MCVYNTVVYTYTNVGTICTRTGSRCSQCSLPSYGPGWSVIEMLGEVNQGI